MPTIVNCDCSDDYPSVSLETLRRDILVRTGFAAQVNTPPPGVLPLIDSFVNSAQQYLYRRYSALRIQRWWTWTCVVNERFYDLAAGDTGCNYVLDPYRITWAGIEDEDNTWTPMEKGINPLGYTFDQMSLPARYDVRQCLEIWPAPDRAYLIRIMGDFLPAPMVGPADLSTINPDALFNFALGLAKRHYNRQDSEDSFRMAGDIVGDLVAGAHATARYVPNSAPPLPWPEPIFLPLVP